MLSLPGGPPIFPPSALVRIFQMLKNSQKTAIFKKFYQASILTNFNFQKRFCFVFVSTFRTKKILDLT